MELALGITLVASGVALGLGALWWKVRASGIQATSELSAARVSASRVPASQPTGSTVPDAPVGFETAGMTDEVPLVAKAIQSEVYGKATVKQPGDSRGDGPKSAEEISPEQSDETPLYRLAQQLLGEVDKVVLDVREQAKRNAEVEAAKIRADAEKSARDEALEHAEVESEARSRESVRAAEEQAEVVLRGANEVAGRLIQDAKEKAQRLESKARERLSRAIHTLTADVSPEVENLAGPYVPADGDGSDALRIDLPNPLRSPSTARR